MAIVGKIKEIWRYPVKSMFGEKQSSAELSPMGFADDRCWAVRDEASGQLVGGKKIPKLMTLKARYRQLPSAGFDKASDAKVEIEFPDGRVLSSDDPYASAVLSMYLGREVSLQSRQPASHKELYKLSKVMTPTELRYALGMKPDDPAPDFSSFSLSLLSTVSQYVTPPGTFYDVYPLHFMTTAALEDMRRYYPKGDFRAERYRPSFLIETQTGIEGIVENKWRGRDLRIGDAVIHCNHPTIRCSMPGAEQPGMEKDPQIPRAVLQHANQHLGAYGTPKLCKTIRVGDDVELLPAHSKVFYSLGAVQRKVKSALLTQLTKLAEKQEKKELEQAKAQQTQTLLAEKSAPPGYREVVLVRKVIEAEGIQSFYFRDAQGNKLPDFVPGQHIVVALPQDNCDAALKIDSGIKSPLFIYRSYTLSDTSRHYRHYRISVKCDLTEKTSPDSASAYLHKQLNVGDHFYIRGPAGQFAVVPSDTRPLVLVSTGIGITPFLSILKTLVRDNPERTVHLIHGIRSLENYAFKEELEECQNSLSNFKLQLFISQPEDYNLDSYMARGRLSVGSILENLECSTRRDAEFYFCGTPEFSQQMHDGFLDAGISKDRIHTESFGASLINQSSENQERYKIKLAVSQRELEWNPAQENLLSFCEDNGINIASGCRYGACHACQATLLNGSVSFPEELQMPEDNKVLLCSARPSSDLELEL
ncbi:MOSC N-terminal beta barrel domain-containing protein [Pseudoteredinibacter isoporae]|uniref:Ferredoxin-NADP reductase/uncharacterized protein YcbX n=1 Tax=Pseudoteredinibacter isoporae TaxID=570281 RepID=A0A7X0MVX1_9GAMM|nr:MOSC N-terminal beta barrel domain-containing protein [Pseudoteredinibacter isoporae]MBB6521838.1 ferredoxin-NADP reductase/uncharacterized protein YcbX [Pseudoteredinibacter isoporae]NHO87382.1 2Fe-2S iron-sulfur cluster binding domain-containing protein [Pseudoteredinibacter isoporae]NIB23206.1 2Fe-2S iron-sulfur cluster binding domain-containing protein [Pseudoteredinibacter isoporae]